MIHMCLKYGDLISPQFVNALIKDIKKKMTVVDFKINVFLFGHFHMPRVHSHIWLDAILRSGDDELGENNSCAVSQRGEGQQRREADTEGLNEQAQRQQCPSRDQVLHRTSILSRVLE